MGLDMYLYATRFLWHGKDDALGRKIAILFPELEGQKIKRVECEVAYWRKANAIHNWFVQNVQDGKDECQYSDVSREDIEKLVSLCEEVLANPKNAMDLLPPVGGFFFGSTEIDEGYFQDLRDTVKMLKPLSDPNIMAGWDLEYHSSW